MSSSAPSLARSRVCNERRCGLTLSDRSSPRRRRRQQRCFKGGAKRGRRPRKVIILRACARLNAELHRYQRQQQRELQLSLLDITKRRGRWVSDELAASSAFFSLGSTPTSVVEQCERIKRKGSETVRRKTLRDGRGRSGVGVRPSVRVARTFSARS